MRHQMHPGRRFQVVAGATVAIVLVAVCQLLGPVTSVDAAVGTPRIVVEQASVVTSLDLSASPALDISAVQVSPRIMVEGANVSHSETLAQPQNGGWDTSAVYPRFIVEGANTSLLIRFAPDGGFSAPMPTGK